MNDTNILLTRIAQALERIAPPPAPPPDLNAADGFVWQSPQLLPVGDINRVSLANLKGIDHVRDILLANTARFADGLPANNALLWGARGMGKSSLVKSVHAEINRTRIDQGRAGTLALVEIHREDLASLPQLLAILKAAPRRCVIFCDDLSFDVGDASYKSLKAVLEGGLEGRPENVLFYATSNRRHLMPRDMIENEQAAAIHSTETIEEKVSLSDRFGLWLGFHNCSQDTYLEMVTGYAEALALKVDGETVRVQALEWATTRGTRNGRVAWQFIQDLAGRMGRAGRPLSPSD